MENKISIIIPTLNDADTLDAVLDILQPLRQRGHEVLVVDGGSRDSTISIARKHADRVLMSGPGRALQMNVGADSSAHPVLLFLRPDTQLPVDADHLINEALRPQGSIWGRFDIRFDSGAPAFRLLAIGSNLKAALTGIATGDQAIFVEKRFFERVGYYDGFPILEDVALSKKLLKFGWPQHIKVSVLIPSQPWKTRGVSRTLLRSWWIRTAYFFGVQPETLAQRYFPEQKGQ